MQIHQIVIRLILFTAGCGSGDHYEVGKFKNDLIGNEIKLEALKDPKVDGVTCHLSYLDRAVLCDYRNLSFRRRSSPKTSAGAASDMPTAV